MREILFRGKRIDNTEWIEGFYFQQPNPCSVDGEPIKHCISDLPPFGAEVIPETVGQYTGLKDKNGNRIFEGDVVRTKFGRFCVVEWLTSPSHNGWDLKPICIKDNLKRDAPTHYDLYSEVNLEIIGNIHDNPNFLRVLNDDQPIL